MSYPFIMETLVKPVLLSLLLLCLPWSNRLLAQTRSIEDTAREYHRDSVVIYKHSKDRLGDQTLKVKVINPCHPRQPPYDAAFGAIECNLTSKRYQGRINFIDTNAQMELIHCSEADVWTYKYKGRSAFLVPFTYCGALDTDNRASCFILYDRKMALVHFDFKCDEQGNQNCILKTRPYEELDRFPAALKKMLIEKMRSRYRTIHSFPE